MLTLLLIYVAAVLSLFIRRQLERMDERIAAASDYADAANSVL